MRFYSDFRPVAYTYEADTHCPDCAAVRFPPCRDHGHIGCGPDEVTDREGNPIGAIFDWQRDGETLYCGDCHEEIE